MVPTAHVPLFLIMTSPSKHSVFFVCAVLAPTLTYEVLNSLNFIHYFVYVDSTITSSLIVMSLSFLPTITSTSTLNATAMMPTKTGTKVHSYICMPVC